MIEARRTGNVWQSIRDLPGRLPLRTKLISVVLALVAVALVVISSAGLIILRNNLLSAPDAYLEQTISRTPDLVRGYLSGNQTWTFTGVSLDWVSGGRVHQVITPVTGPSQGNPSGFPAQASQTMPGPSVPTSASWLAANSGRIITLPAQSGGGRWRVLMTPEQYQYNNGSTVTGTIVLATDVTSAYTTIGQLADIDLLASLAVICVLGIVVVALIRRSLRPLIEIEQTAGAIAAGDLSRRVPELDPRTEVGRLGRSLNVMLSVIEAAFHAQSTSEAAARRSEDKMRQFVADASHELRTPLTTIRSSAEAYRQRGGIESGENGSGHLTKRDIDRTMRRIEQESERMGVLVADMLLLAQLDKQRPLQSSPVDLLTLAADAVHDAQVVAPDRSIHLTVGSGAALIVNGDEMRLRQVISNLMNNALTHTPAGTPIDVRIRSGYLDEAPTAAPADLDDLEPPDAHEPPDDAIEPPDDAVGSPGAWEPARAHQPAAVLEVSDHGPGLTKHEAEHVFERFYRADRARTAGGTGLGLAIVAALVAGHGGATWVRSVPSEGATFCIALPLTPEAAEGPDEDDGPADLDEANHDPTLPQGNPEEGASGAEHDDSAFQQYWARLDSPGG